MNIWVPKALYQVFPLLCVITGFLFVALMHNPFAIVIATCMYVYSFTVMWLRQADDDGDKN
jgi:hypothetical protein